MHLCFEGLKQGLELCFQFNFDSLHGNMKLTNLAKMSDKQSDHGW